MPVLRQKQSLLLVLMHAKLGNLWYKTYCGLRLVGGRVVNIIEWVTAVFSPRKGGLKIILISLFIFLPRVKLAIDGI